MHKTQKLAYKFYLIAFDVQKFAVKSKRSPNNLHKLKKIKLLAQIKYQSVKKLKLVPESHVSKIPKQAGRQKSALVCRLHHSARVNQDRRFLMLLILTTPEGRRLGAFTKHTHLRKHHQQ